MRQFQTTFAFLLLLGLSTACEKDKPEPTETNQHVYTNGVEIKDEAVKQRFIQRSFVPFTSSGLLGPDDVVRFIVPDTATFGTGTLYFSVVRNGAQHLFYSVPAIRVSDPNALLWKILKYTSPVFAVPAASSFGSATKEVRVGYREGNTMRISRLHYCIRRTSAGVNNAVSGVLFNEFNPSSISSVRAGDTLAIQESSLTVPVQ